MTPERRKAVWAIYGVYDYAFLTELANLVFVYKVCGPHCLTHLTFEM